MRSMLMAVATKQAWVRMESFAKSGAAEGNFDVSCLLSDIEDSKCKKNGKIDWEAVSNLISAATEAAVGAGMEREEEEMVELLGCLSELRMFAAEGCRTQNEVRSVGGEVKSRIMTPEQSELLFLRAVSAVSIHRRKALTQLQNSPDPGEDWLVEHGELMENALDWMIKAYPKLPDRDKIAKFEEVFRAVEHMGKPVEHMDHTVVDSHMRDLPESLRDSLRDTMKNGVRTGIPRPEETNQAKATDTAIANFEKVAKEMRKGTVHGWMRAIPPSRRDMLSKWGILILVSNVHYAEPPNDRVVTDLTGSGANESSPESEHGYAKEKVQCDYVDVVVEETVKCLDLVSMFSDEELTSVNKGRYQIFLHENTNSP